MCDHKKCLDESHINFKENENSHENIVKPEVIQKKNKRKEAHDLFKLEFSKSPYATFSLLFLIDE